jgi:ATP-binding cassette subfamily C (CFTR/MRP) protein 1
MAPPGPDLEKDDLRTESPATAGHGDLEEKLSLDLPESKGGSDSLPRKSESAGDEEKHTGLHLAQTYATTASAMTGPEPQAIPKQKPWYKNLNPLRWGKIPPVPEVRTVSREYNAPFLSLVYFQWIAPIMKVSTFFRHGIYCIKCWC